MKRYKILAVDDEKKILNFIANTLQEYEVIQETSPLQAIELLHSNHFDIILSDYSMPMINGIELLEEAKLIYNDRRYVSILCTAYGTTYIFELDRKEGLFQFFLEKPFNERTLQQAITQGVALLENECAGVR